MRRSGGQWLLWSQRVSGARYCGVVRIAQYEERVETTSSHSSFFILCDLACPNASTDYTIDCASSPFSKPLRSYMSSITLRGHHCDVSLQYTTLDNMSAQLADPTSARRASYDSPLLSVLALINHLDTLVNEREASMHAAHHQDGQSRRHSERAVGLAGPASKD